MKLFSNIEQLPRTIPIFPLTGAVLFRTQLPLNIFEPRYVKMIDDALSSRKIVRYDSTRFTKSRNR